MINKLSALSLAHEVLVQFAKAGFHCSLNVGSDGSTPQVNVSVFYDKDSAVGAIELLLYVSKIYRVTASASHSENSQWFDFYISFENENNN